MFAPPDGVFALTRASRKKVCITTDMYSFGYKDPEGLRMVDIAIVQGPTHPNSFQLVAEMHPGNRALAMCPPSCAGTCLDSVKLSKQ